jgi:hypothetical protein
MRRNALIVGVALLVGACARAPEAGSGQVLIPQGGDVQLQHDGEWRAVTETVNLSRGDRIRVGDLGRAVLELPGGTLELRQGSTLRVGSIPELETGSLLARATPGLAVGVGPVQVRAEDSVYRVDRSLSVRVGVYRGAVSLPGSGWDGAVTALRQVGVVGDTVPRGPVALQVDPGDPWDDRLLGDAIDVGRRLQRFQGGVAFELPRRGGRDLVAAALPLDPRTVLRGLPKRASVNRLSEVLVASVVAATAAPAREIAPASAFRHVMGLRRIGASWIVVAAEWQLARSVLGTLIQVTSLLTRELSPPAAGPGGDTGGGATTGPSTTGPSTVGGSTGTSTGGDGTGDGSTDGGDGSTEEPVPPPPGCTDLATCTVEDVLDGAPDPNKALS